MITKRKKKIYSYKNKYWKTINKKILRKNKINVFACTDVLNKQKIFLFALQKGIRKDYTWLCPKPYTPLWKILNKKFGRNKF